MIIDTSALVAVLAGEPDASEIYAAMRGTPSSRLSAANYLETGIVIDARRNPVLSRRVDELLASLDTEVVPVTEEQARSARQAYRDFGKGSGHPAQLNFGDCFAYALAAETGEPLLFGGANFTHAGVRSALNH